MQHVDPEDGRERQLSLDLLAGGRRFSLPMEASREVALAPTLVSAIPRTRSPLLGAFNLRGRVVALVDLAGLFGLQAEAHDPDLARAVLLERMAVALLVDEVVGISSLEGGGSDRERERLSAPWILSQVEGMLHPRPGSSGDSDALDSRRGEQPWRSAF